MAATQQPESRTLERGDIYFVYTPRVRSPGEQVEVQGLEDIERTYMVLSVQGERQYRRIVLGRKRLPDAERRGERFWGFVDIVGRRPEKIEDQLEEVKYDTATRGQRIRPEARPAGEGIYRIVEHGNHNHLVYALELPQKPGAVQQELNIQPEASYIFSVKNPEASAPSDVGLSAGRKVDYPDGLLQKFQGRRFLPAVPELLNYAGAEVLLIGSSEDPRSELGIELHPEPENVWSADVFNDLRMERARHPTEPLFTGEWR